MTALYIFLALLGLIVLLLLIPVQVGIHYREDLYVWVRYGLIKFRLYPSKEDHADKPSRPAKKPQKAARKSRLQKKKAPLSDKLSEIAENMKQDSLSEMLEELKALVRLVTKTTRRLLNALVIDRLYLTVDIATGQADTTAIRYGQVCGVISSAQAVLGETMRIRKQKVAVTPRFLEETSRVAVELRIHALPLRLAAVAVSAFFGFIQWTDSSSEAKPD